MCLSFERTPVAAAEDRQKVWLHDPVGPDFQSSQAGSSHQHQKISFKGLKAQMTLNDHNTWIYP